MTNETRFPTNTVLNRITPEGDEKDTLQICGIEEANYIVMAIDSFSPPFILDQREIYTNYTATLPEDYLEKVEYQLSPEQRFAEEGQFSEIKTVPEEEDPELVSQDPIENE